MGMADIAQVLWSDFLKHNPGNPQWHDRDRFLLSNGHGSMLLYSLLHLTGYPLSLEEIENFRQLGSHTAGHPEHEPALGIETTTGPLGQGLANAVGLALAERMLATQFNRPGFSVVDHYTYVFCGDGCLMEGISHEACSFAGTLRLGKLIAFYDDNGISIDGKVKGWFTDDTAKRFEAYGWHVVPDVDGHDAEAVAAAIRAARAETDAPLDDLLPDDHRLGRAAQAGYPGSPRRGAGRGRSGGHPQGHRLAVRALRHSRRAARRLGPSRPAARPRSRPGGSCSRATPAPTRSSRASSSAACAASCPRTGERPLSQALAAGLAQQAPQATRQSSQATLNVIAPRIPEIFGGSADLTGSNNTKFKAAREFDPKEASGNYIHYGVREFGMTAVMNGIALHGGFLPYGGTFLVFSDYARNGVRLAALMKHACRARLYSRLGRSRGGRPHAPADRAPDEPSGHAEPVPSGGRATPSRPRSRGRRPWSGPGPLRSC